MESSHQSSSYRRRNAIPFRSHALIQWMRVLRRSWTQVGCGIEISICCMLTMPVAMVLDYNKLHVNRRRKTSSSNGSRDTDREQQDMPATTNMRSEPIFANDQDCDVALITEEVIDGKWAITIRKV